MLTSSAVTHCYRHQTSPLPTRRPPRPEYDPQGRPVLTPSLVRYLCTLHGGYHTPHLNSTLYLHHQSLPSVPPTVLDPYHNLTSIYLHHNAITRIQGLDHLTRLKCLFLNENAISTIEGLDALKELETLDLAGNAIEDLRPPQGQKGLEGLKGLRTLGLGRNALRDVEGVSVLRGCKGVGVLGLEGNRIAERGLVEVLEGMENLAVLTLTGNPLPRTLPSYRKHLTLCLPNLTHLDDAPITATDRRLASAWQRGGLSEERRERGRVREERERERREGLEAFRRMQRRACERRRKREGKGEGGNGDEFEGQRFEGGLRRLWREMVDRVTGQDDEEEGDRETLVEAMDAAGHAGVEAEKDEQEDDVPCLQVNVNAMPTTAGTFPQVDHDNNATITDPTAGFDLD